MKTKTRKQQFKTGFMAGLVAGIIATLVMIGLSIVANGISLPEVVGSELNLAPMPIAKALPAADLDPSSK